MFYTTFPTKFGFSGFAWNEVGLTAFSLPEENIDEVATRLQQNGEPKAPDGNIPFPLKSLIQRVQNHLEGNLQDFVDLNLDWTNLSDFKRDVYLETRSIKPGLKKSYGNIARALGLGAKGAQAVGAALGRNPWPLVVPCHRVVSACGKMTGFSGPGGIRTKARLLALEGAELLSE